MTIQIKETIRRLFIGMAMGAFIGGLELWFYEFNLRHGIAAILFGAFFGSALGIFGPFMLKGITTTLISSSIIGSLSGVLWWAIAKPNVNVLFSVGFGIVLGLLFVFGEVNWKRKNQGSVQLGVIWEKINEQENVCVDSKLGFVTETKRHISNLTRIHSE